MCAYEEHSRKEAEEEMKHILQMTVLMQSVPHLTTTVPLVDNKHSFLHTCFMLLSIGVAASGRDEDCVACRVRGWRHLGLFHGLRVGCGVDGCLGFRSEGGGTWHVTVG
ncbi:unnamed protein product [Heterobilharzia americana]|nr:unnamed protein product [Heterobilharzia americana]